MKEQDRKTLKKALGELLNTTGLAITIGNHPYPVVDVGVTGHWLFYKVDGGDRWHTDEIRNLKIHSANQFTINGNIDIAPIGDFPELASTLDVAVVASMLQDERRGDGHRSERQTWINTLGHGD